MHYTVDVSGLGTFGHLGQRCANFTVVSRAIFCFDRSKSKLDKSHRVHKSLNVYGSSQATDTNKRFDEPFSLATPNTFQTRAVPCWWQKSHSNAEHTTTRQHCRSGRSRLAPKSLLLVVNGLQEKFSFALASKPTVSDKSVASFRISKITFVDTLYTLA